MIKCLNQIISENKPYNLRLCTIMKYNDDIYNEKLTIIEDKIHEMSDKSLSDFGLPASNRNNSNSNRDPLEEALQKSYDLNKSSEYINLKMNLN